MNRVFALGLTFFSCWLALGADREKVMFIGAHPDDTEAFMGTALLLNQKYEVHIIDFTRGEGGCGEAGFKDGSTALKRIAEEREVCKAFGTEPIFLSQINYQGRYAYADAKVTTEIEQLLMKLKPRAVFTHWPVDSHPDHVQCSAAVQHALWNVARDHGFRPEFYFFEEPPWQTLNYRPTYFVNVEAVAKVAASLIAKYQCQNGAKIAAQKAKRLVERGREAPIPVSAAETFATRDGKPIIGGVIDEIAVTLREIRGIDLSEQTNTHAFVRHGTKTDYWGHPTTAMLNDGKTVYCVYPYGHGGRGGFLSVSEDGGQHWRDVSERLPAIARRYYNCPCLHKLLTPKGNERLIYWQSGIAPTEKIAQNACFVKSASSDDSTAMPACVSDDGGLTWRALQPQGSAFRNILPFQGIVALKGSPGRYLGVYHRGSIGCYDWGHLEVLAATTEDGGLTWSNPRVIAEDPRWQLCEPWLFRAPDGNELCCLIRENGGTRAKVIFSSDEGATWSKPIDAPWFLNGHRHQGLYLQDGRLAIVFRCVEKGYRYYGQFIAWIGTYDELKSGREGKSCHIKILHNFSSPWDCGYAGIHQLPDGTLLATTYNVCAPNEKCSVVSVRFKVPSIY